MEKDEKFIKGKVYQCFIAKEKNRPNEFYIGFPEDVQGRERYSSYIGPVFLNVGYKQLPEVMRYSLTDTHFSKRCGDLSYKTNNYFSAENTKEASPLLSAWFLYCYDNKYITLEDFVKNEYTYNKEFNHYNI